MLLVGAKYSWNMRFVLKAVLVMKVVRDPDPGAVPTTRRSITLHASVFGETCQTHVDA